MGKRVQLSLHFNTQEELQVYESLVKPLKNNKQLRLTLVELLKVYAKFPTEMLTLVNNPRSFIVKDKEMEEFTDKIQEVETQLNLFSFFLEQTTDTVESLSPENIEDTLENYKSFRESAEKEGLVSPQGIQESISIDKVDISDHVIREMEDKIKKLEQKVEKQTEEINNKLDVLIDKLSTEALKTEAPKQDSIQDQLMMQLLINLTQTNQQVLQQGVGTQQQTEAVKPIKQEYSIPSGVLEPIEPVKEEKATEAKAAEATNVAKATEAKVSEATKPEKKEKSEEVIKLEKILKEEADVKPEESVQSEETEEFEGDASSLLFDAISDSMI